MANVRVPEKARKLLVEFIEKEVGKQVYIKDADAQMVLGESLDRFNGYLHELTLEAIKGTVTDSRICPERLELNRMKESIMIKCSENEGPNISAGFLGLASRGDLQTLCIALGVELPNRAS